LSIGISSGNSLAQKQPRHAAVDGRSKAIDGVTENPASVEILMQNEKVVKSACQQFNVLLNITSSFGGEEVVDID